LGEEQLGDVQGAGRGRFAERLVVSADEAGRSIAS
jgi:hypothetical protein